MWQVIFFEDVQEAWLGFGEDFEGLGTILGSESVFLSGQGGKRHTSTSQMPALKVITGAGILPSIGAKEFNI